MEYLIIIVVYFISLPSTRSSETFSLFFLVMWNRCEMFYVYEAQMILFTLMKRIYLLLAWLDPNKSDWRHLICKCIPRKQLLIDSRKFWEKVWKFFRLKFLYFYIYSQEPNLYLFVHMYFQCYSFNFSEILRWC